VPPLAEVSLTPAPVVPARVPRTSMSPATVVRPLALARLIVPPICPLALSSAPASIVKAPRCVLMLTVPPLPVTGLGAGIRLKLVVGTARALALICAPFSIATGPLSLLISICPPFLFAMVASATVWLPCASVRSACALRTILPPSPLTAVARISPLCFNVPANTPTAPPLSLPSTVAALALACTSNFMSFKLRLPISTFSPAANTTLPPSLLITPSLPSVTSGAMM